MYVYLGERINDQGKGKNMHVLFIYLSHSFVFVLLVSCFIKYVFIFRNKMHTKSMDESVFFLKLAGAIIWSLRTLTVWNLLIN